ncbi:DUF2786 domain-containing protein [Streptomyces vastus]|uniref:DUF2786 domain-containing protein n=1 Tax=Streptomyces vastus TaxID=285451 RepID=A0ABP6CUA9_9ACTN
MDRAFKTALYADTDTTLDTAASLLAADPSADAELALRGEEFIATAWRRGWQPADVVRIVRRELDETHVRLVSGLILGSEARQKQPRGRRWAAQLEDLDPSTVRTDRFSHATAVLELYRLLLRLPSLEPLDGPTARPPHKTPGERQAPESRILPRIRALLAKAEATGFPEEAEALTGKAQELMARHSIDEALLAARTPAADAPGACRIGIDPPYETAQATLLDAVAAANRCRAVWNEALGFSTVVGFEPDLEAVELLHTSLLVQATAAMTKAEAAARASGRRRTKTFRQSFLAAYAHRIATRLTSAAETQVTEDLLPVLATREAAVTDRTDRLFPETTTTRLRGVNDAAGWTLGAEAADRAQVERHQQPP